MGNSAEQDSERDRRVDEAVAAYFQALEAGRPPSRDEFLARYPDLADELASFLDARAAFAGHAGPAPAPRPANEIPTVAEEGAPVEAMPVLGTVRYFGDYELLQEIARGGMGVVYKARQVSLDRVVALKMILSGQLAGDNDVRRFRQEARTAASLQHPNIVAIHEVGEHEGQHYFSMGYVEGHSLAELVRDHPLPPPRAVRYVRVIAEAVHFAHRRGVLHRDLKPSNVLIDEQDEPRVTDFGLAKRTDQDASLTATGAVVGTPSYMPPEQASGKRGRLGPASDVYALGAVLYELVTGRPPFRAATAMDTLLQVLEAEPASPRLLNPAISRDLETVILKCLAKDPARRYPTAAELAEDLQALLDGRPVKARRPGLPERAARWLSKEKRSLSVAAKAALLSLLLTGFGWLAVSLALDERRGQLVLDTDGPSLRAEVLHPGREEVLARFRVPHEDPVALPGGPYRVRLSAPGQLSQTFHLLLANNQPPPLQVRLPGRPHDELLAPQPHDVWELADLAGRADLILARGDRLSRLDGASRRPVWEVIYQPPGPGGVFDKTAPPPRRITFADPFNRPRLVRPAPDLDGDGTRDLVWVGQPSARVVGPSETLWAISGKDGKELWWREAGGRVLGLPVVADVDGEGKPGLVATLELSPGQGKQVQRWVEAFSGSTGRSRWRYPLDGRWHGPVSQAAQVWQAAGKDAATLVCLNGTRLVGLDPRTGRPAFEHALGFRPVQAPVFADLVGDGRPDALLLRQGPDKQLTVVALALPAGKRLWEYPLAMTHGPQLLVADLDGDGRPEILVVNRETEFPRGDGPDRAQAAPAPMRGGLVEPGPPDRQPDPVPATGRWAARGVDVLDGATGARRWRYEGTSSGVPLLVVGHGVAGKHQVLVGPDIRAEGCRAVFLAVRRPVQVPRPNAPPAPFESLVVALSGRDGRTLWQAPLPLPENDNMGPWLNEQGTAEYGLQGWWPAGAHEWPLLLALAEDRFVHQPGPSPTVVMLSAGTGRTEHTLPQASDLKLADLDGDGLPELCYRHYSGRDAPCWYALRGGPPVAWRHLGRLLPAADLDGDGVGDLLSTEAGQLTAVSGRDGRLLWQSPHVPRNEPAPAPAFADLDGDGAADVLVAGSYSGSNFVPLRALSGKDGRELWGASHLEGPTDNRFERGQLVACHDLDGDGRPEVVFLYETSDRTGPGVRGYRFGLAVLRGDTGALRWRQAVPGRTGGPDRRLAVADLDGDGVRDLVFLLVGDDGVPVLHALSGRDGRALWERSLRLHALGGLTPDRIFFAAGDLDGDGKAEVVLALAGKSEVLILNGADGKTRARAGGLRIDSFPNLWHTGASPLLLLDRPGGGPTVCVAGRRSDWLGDRHQVTQRLTLLDGAGKTVGMVERPLKPSADHSEEAVRVWAGDLAGDSKKALVLVTAEHVEALRGDGRSLWRWPLPAGTERAHVVALLPAGKKHPAWVVVQTQDALYGLDGRTGRAGWRCSAGPSVALLPGNHPDGWPRVVHPDSASGATLCLLPLPTDAAGTYRLPVARGAAEAPPPAEEARGQPLPWAQMRFGRTGVLLVLPYLLLLVFTLLRGDWTNLVRLLVGAATLGVVFSSFLLALDTAPYPPGSSYAWAGWYWIFLWTAVGLGWVVLPPVVLRALLNLAGWGGRWILWVVPPIVILVLVGVFPWLLVRGSSGEQRPPQLGYLLWALAAVLVGGVLLLGPPLWRRLVNRTGKAATTGAEG
jgi:outer membrane protein assembly factor BamB